MSSPSLAREVGLGTVAGVFVAGVAAATRVRGTELAGAAAALADVLRGPPGVVFAGVAPPGAPERAAGVLPAVPGRVPPGAALARPAVALPRWLADLDTGECPRTSAGAGCATGF